MKSRNRSSCRSRGRIIISYRFSGGYFNKLNYNITQLKIFNTSVGNVKENKKIKKIVEEILDSVSTSSGISKKSDNTTASSGTTVTTSTTTATNTTTSTASSSNYLANIVSFEFLLFPVFILRDSLVFTLLTNPKLPPWKYYYFKL
ncbi:hypothetical protein ACTA71_005060 [Dictyostelium dimigraforme]